MSVSFFMFPCSKGHLARTYQDVRLLEYNIMIKLHNSIIFKTFFRNEILARFWPIFDFELNEKRSRAEPSREYGLSQLGSDSSLIVFTHSSMLDTHSIYNLTMMQWLVRHALLAAALPACVTYVSRHSPTISQSQGKL